MSVELKETTRNVFDLTLDEPVQEKASVNIENLFTQEDWDNITSRMSKLSKSHNFIEFLRDLKIVSPTRVKKYLPNNFPRIFSLDQLAAAEMIRPGYARAVNPHLNWKMVQNEIPDISRLDSATMRNCWKVIGLYPEKLKECDLENVARQSMRIKNSTAVFIQLLFVNSASTERLILGDEQAQLYKTADFGSLTEYFHLLQSLAESDDISVTELMEYARNLKIIAAKHVILTRGGLEIIMGDEKSIDDKNSSLPEVRSF